MQARKPLIAALPSLSPLESDFSQSDWQDSLSAQAYQLQCSGQLEAAVSLYEKSVADGGESAESVVNLGACYLRLGLLAKARRLYALASVSTAETRFNYALATAAIGKRYEALKAFRECAASEGEVASLSRLAVRCIEDLPPSKPLPLWPTEPEFDFSMVVKSAPKLVFRKHKSCVSLASTSNYCQKKEKAKDEEKRSNTPAARRRPKTTVKVSRKEERKATLLKRNSIFSVVSVSESVQNNEERAHRHGSFIEEDLETSSALQTVWAGERALHSAVARMDKQLLLACEKSVLTYQSLPLPRSKKLRPGEIEAIRSEMSKVPELRDVSLLVSLVTRLKFFEKFKADVRREFLRVGMHTRVLAKDYVFYQGDVSSHVYAIFSGTISVWRQAAEYGTEPLIVNTLYEGDSFGDLSLFKDNGSIETGRTASCQAVEDTDLFYLTKEEYQRIMIREVEIGLQVKLSFLCKLPFFTGLNEFVLVPLATTLVPLKYKLGQYVLRSGEVPKGMHIVVTGRCSVHSEGYFLAKKEKPGLPEGAASALGWTVVPESKRKEKCEHVLTRETIARDVNLQRELRAFFQVERLSPLLRKYTIYRERMLEVTLPEGSFFAGRCLTAFSQAKVTPSKYSVIADSAEVVLYIVTGSQAPLLGEKVMNRVTKLLNSLEDPDSPSYISKERMRRNFQLWQQYKGKVVSRVARKLP